MVFVDNIQDIKETFFELQQPQFKLYNGKPKATYPSGRSATSNLLYNQNDPNMDLTDAWNRLEPQLARFAGRGGYANLWVGTKDGDHYNIPIYFPHRNEPGNMQNQTGVAGMPQAYGPYGINAVLEDKMRIYDLEHKIDEVANSQNQGIGQRLIDRILENDALVANLLSTFTSAMLGGIPRNYRPPQPVQGQKPEVGAELPPVDVSELGLHFVERIKSGFSTEAEMQGYLNKVADLFSRDPETMKRVIDTIAQQNQENAQ